MNWEMKEFNRLKESEANNEVYIKYCEFLIAKLSRDKMNLERRAKKYKGENNG